MFDISWIFGHGKTSYTSHKSPAPLKTKSGKDTTLPELAASSIPPCRLNPFLFNGHLQTMYTAVKDPGPPIHYKRQIFTSDHPVYPGTFAIDFVVSPTKASSPAADADADTASSPTLPERTTNFLPEEWTSLPNPTDTTPMLIALHGLTGGSHEVYLRETLAPLTSNGWAACVVNGRGCALSRITTPQLFNSRATWDVRQTIKYLHEIFPNRPLYAVGFSLGANILTNYCSEEGDACILNAAVACSNPWNLELCNTELQRTWLGLEVYARTMGKNLMGLFERHREQILQIEGVDEEMVRKSRYIFEFDRHVQCPTWGYPSEGAYYRDAQSVDALLGVRIPFLGINAEDDPISSKAAIPYQEFKQNPYALLCTTNWGGHLGSFQLGGGRWFAVAASSFLAKMHQDIDHDASRLERKKTKVDTPEKKYPIFDPNNRRLILPDA
ncbi:similar to medium-chain fatty acid ethyl ester synthase/esterase 1 [Plenodomus lingam JN3]|uniref:alcohol O-acetyltransferase n=2 Tax=Leptosphaeria maculans TaxID=5022 RepID=E5A0I2_LEPMJ|nr:similar to medium-chain fatty acid ethyl ester synthase/esterase 1 [Plenodomus lingam JN3]CBX97042.1 similar to medium-chain fatty acid ethyl ester synthase/esterase 1 [Plenodomus lingam JN3]